MPHPIPFGGAVAAPPATDADGRRVGLLLGLLVLPMFVAMGAPSVALPVIARALAVPFGATSWILTAWSLTSAVAMLVAGPLAARWSALRVLVVGVVALSAGSALAAVGTTLPVVIVGRLLGGAGAGATVIAVFVIASALPGRSRVRALAIVATASATASACGTLLGGAITAWAGWRAVLALPVLALPLLLIAWAGRRAFPRTGVNPPAGRLLLPRRAITARGVPAAGIVGGAIFAGYYGVLFLAPSLLEQATGGGPLEAGALLVPAAACSALAGRALEAASRRFTAWQTAAGLAALAVMGILVVATLDGPVPVVVGTALVACGFAGAQTVLMGLTPDLVAPADRDTTQGLLSFMIFLGGAIGPGAVAGLSGHVPGPSALAVLAALPLIGFVVAVTRRPGVRV